MRIAFVTYRALPQLSEDDRLAVTELRRHAIEVESAVWDSPLVDWTVYDALVLRSTWDYHLRAPEFERWLALIEHLGVPLWNPAPLVRWNMDKRYLHDLAARGFPTVETLVLEKGSTATLGHVMELAGWRDVVYKPAISASGYRTARATIDQLPQSSQEFSALLAERDVLVQPFVPEIVTDGEWSMLFFHGQFSHAVKKRATSEEFRVQTEHGGVTTNEVPRAALIAQAEQVVAQLPAPWLFARVDACEVAGRLVLMEVELVEPSLFLAHDPSAPRRFAAAIRQLAWGRKTPLSVTPRSLAPSDGLPA